MKASDYGERLIAGARPGTWTHVEMSLVAPHDDAPFPHWHDRQVEQYRGQLVECQQCGFWLPPGRACPLCGAARGRHRPSRS